jgi:hypothetical protein
MGFRANFTEIADSRLLQNGKIPFNNLEESGNGAQRCEGKGIRDDSWIIPIGCNSEQKGERKKSDPLIPAKGAGLIEQYLSKIDAEAKTR